MFIVGDVLLFLGMDPAIQPFNSYYKELRTKKKYKNNSTRIGTASDSSILFMLIGQFAATQIVRCRYFPEWSRKHSSQSVIKLLFSLPISLMGTNFCYDDLISIYRTNSEWHMGLTAAVV